jgi:hypothetical protein
MRRGFILIHSSRLIPMVGGLIASKRLIEQFGFTSRSVCGRDVYRFSLVENVLIARRTLSVKLLRPWIW